MTAMGASDRRAYLVTGAAGSIGSAICRRLLAAGHDVIGTDRAAAIEGELQWVRGDLTDPVAQARIAAACTAGIDGIVIATGMLEPMAWEGIGAEDATRLFAVNVVAPALLIRDLASMIRPGGAAVLIGSISAIRAAPAAPLYAASKAAVHSIGASLALLLEPLGIRVNVLAPGLIDTPLTGELDAKTAEARGCSIDDVRAERLRPIPMGRMGTPDEVAGACLFLLGEDAGYVTGATLFATGGAMAGTI